MLRPGETAPLIRGGTPISMYECEGYRAILTDSPESFGPVKYPHVLIVFKAIDDTPPIMFITAEQNSMMSMFAEHLPEHMKEEFGSDFGKGYFLGLFDENGHHNLGKKDNLENIQFFEVHALEAMKNHLGLTSEIKKTDDTRTDSGGGITFMGFLKALPALAIILYVAYYLLTK